MFYIDTFLCKKGKLAIIWLAAHCPQSKLNKNQVAHTDIPNSVVSIVGPELPLALRLQGHLLLGVARIYALKVQFLLRDCNDALTKIKLAGGVDLSSITTAPAQLSTITRARRTEELDIEDLMAEEELFRGAHTAFRSDITLADLEVPETQRAVAADIFDTFLPADELSLISTRLLGAEEQESITAAIADGAPFGEDLFTDMGEMYHAEIPSTPSALGIELPETPMTLPGMTPIGAITPLTTPSRFAPLPLVNTSPASSPAAVAAVERRRVRKIRVDSSTVLTDAVFAENLQNTDSIVRDPEVAPNTKRRMLREYRENESNDVGRWFVPGHINNTPLAPELSSLFARLLEPTVDAPPAEHLPEPEMQRDQSELDVLPRISDTSGLIDEQGDHFAEPDISFGDIGAFSPPRVDIEERFEQEHETGTVSLEPEAQPLASQPDTDITSRQRSERNNQKVKSYLQQKFADQGEPLLFNALMEEDHFSRSDVARMFYHLLVLGSSNDIRVDQDEPYTEISISKSLNFERSAIASF